jgi:site-specific DNA recombinase
MRAVIYTRVSCARQRDEIPHDLQRDKCEILVRENGWELTDYSREDDTLALTQKRPAYRQMHEGIGEGRFDVVIVWRLDRFGLGTLDLMRFLAYCQDHGVHVLSFEERFYTRTPLGQGIMAFARNVGASADALVLERNHKGRELAKTAGRKGGRARGQVALTPEKAAALIDEHGGVREAARNSQYSPALISKRAKLLLEPDGPPV